MTHLRTGMLGRAIGVLVWTLKWDQQLVRQQGIGLAFGILRVFTLPHMPQWRRHSGQMHSPNHSFAASSVGIVPIIRTSVGPSRKVLSGDSFPDRFSKFGAGIRSRNQEFQARLKFNLMTISARTGLIPQSVSSLAQGFTESVLIRT